MNWKLILSGFFLAGLVGSAATGYSYLGGWPGALAGAVGAFFVSIALSGFVLAVGMGNFKQAIGYLGGVVLIIVAILGILWGYNRKMSPIVNPIPVPEECSQVLNIMGLSSETTCPTSKREWIVLIAANTIPLSADIDYQGNMVKALFGPCPELCFPGECDCRLDPGSFSVAYGQYLDAKRAQIDKRWVVANLDIESAAVLAMLLGVLNLWVGITALDKFGLGTKITATTIFLFIVLIAMGIDGDAEHFVLSWFLGMYPPGIGNTIDNLVGLGFAISVGGPVIGLATFLLSMSAGAALTGSKGGGVVFGILGVIVTIGLTAASTALGLIPGWATFLGIMKAMEETPGLTVAVAAKAVFLGSLLAPGLTSLLGTAWTVLTLAPTMYKISKL